MPNVTLSDYFCGDKEIQFSHFRIPRQLITHPRFKPLSADAKLLYGMLLNRMSLSAKNGWHDNTGRVYIYFTVKEVCEAIGCGRNKAMRLLAELDTSKGIGLIERIKQGQGKPDRIFVKRITVQENMEAPGQGPAAPISPADFSDVQRSEKSTSRHRENRRLEVSKANPNYTDKNQTDFIHTNQSIYPPTPAAKQTVMDRYELRENPRENSMYYEHLQFFYCSAQCWGNASHGETHYEKETAMRKREHFIGLWLDDTEYKHLLKQCVLSGLKASALIWHSIMGVNIQPKPPDTYAALLRELSAIGNNVNQIAYWANTTKGISKTEFAEAAALVRCAWRLVKDTL
ncbi:MAG: plasmid mobilization relaxosome protein MobC [Lachnospiraceae bacterium]|nr:plasmid mobilization relaxosome protein MobC [Lachnospiraceae bacterium]